MTLTPSLQVAILLAALVSAGPLHSQTVQLERAHAHNDYEQERPLLDALARGFTSIEADIHLVNGTLLVAHDPGEVVEGRTLQSLYLEPLQDLSQDGENRIYPGGASLVLLIDIKTEAEPTYRALSRALQPFVQMLTKFTDYRVEEGAVTVIVSGNRAREMMLPEATRLAAFDGRLEDLGGAQQLPVSFMPLVSANWASVTDWNGQGEFPEPARQELDRLVGLAHAQGRKIRFWATADKPEVWQVLYDAGVDLLGTDDLAGLQDFLLQEVMGSE